MEPCAFPYCGEVCAVDIAPQALAVLERNIAKKQITNIRAICEDMFHAPLGEPYDAMVFCFFGSIPEAFRIARAQCRGKVFLIKRDWAAHRFTIKGALPARHTLTDAETMLQELKIPYTSERFTLEMGQPFSALEDAVLFFQTYGQSAGDITVTEVGQRLLYRATDAKFPYYLPVKNRMGLIVLNTGDIPNDTINPVLLGG